MQLMARGEFAGFNPYVTKREFDLLDQLFHGSCYNIFAASMNLSEGTVRNSTQRRIWLTALLSLIVKKSRFSTEFIVPRRLADGNAHENKTFFYIIFKCKGIFVVDFGWRIVLVFLVLFTGWTLTRTA